jgi:hypothetical protein
VVQVDVGDRRIEGRLRLAVGDRTQVVFNQYGTENGKRHVRAWLQHLVVCAALPDERPRTVFQYRTGTGRDPGVDLVVHPNIAPDTARHELSRWLELHDRARRERVAFVATVSWTYACQRRTAERLAVEHGGADLAEVEGLNDFELLEQYGSVARGKQTVGDRLGKALKDAGDAWGREDADSRGFPEREQPEIRLVFRDLLRWDDLIRQTDMLDVAIDLLRPAIDAIAAGEEQAAELRD